MLQLCLVRLKDVADVALVTAQIQALGGTRVRYSGYIWHLLFDGDPGSCEVVSWLSEVADVEYSNVLVPNEPGAHATAIEFGQTTEFSRLQRVAKAAKWMVEEFFNAADD